LLVVDRSYLCQSVTIILIRIQINFHDINTRLISRYL